MPEGASVQRLRRRYGRGPPPYPPPQAGEDKSYRSRARTHPRVMSNSDAIFFLVTTGLDPVVYAEVVQ